MTSTQQKDLHLLNGITQFLEDFQDPELDRFRDAIAQWGTEWQQVPASHLDAADYLSALLGWCSNETQSLMSLLARSSEHCHWEQSYKKSDGVVSDAMLAGYGFAEVIGKQGPFISDRVRVGFGVWGPDINYPPHQHQAEELYLVLSGAATFRIGNGESKKQSAGDCVYVPPMAIHGFNTGKLPLVVLYIWQAGDLREVSSFV